MTKVVMTSLETKEEAKHPDTFSRMMIQFNPRASQLNLDADRDEAQAWCPAHQVLQVTFRNLHTCGKKGQVPKIPAPKESQAELSSCK